MLQLPILWLENITWLPMIVFNVLQTRISPQYLEFQFFSES